MKTRKKDKDLTINIYLMSKDTPGTVNAFLESLKAKDTATIFMGHSSYRGNPSNRIGISVSGLVIGNSQATGNQRTSHSADGVDVQNAIFAVFSCGYGKAFDNITSSNGTAFVSIIQGTGEGAHQTTRTTAVNAAAFEFTQSIANSSWNITTFQSTLGIARNRGQSGINANPHPDPNVNAGDYVGYRILPPPRKK